MTKLFIHVLLLGSLYATAQSSAVGVNTLMPQSTLDVNGKVGNDGKSLATDVTGLQAPRLTREELTWKGDNLYGIKQKGAQVYITDVTGGTAQAQRVNITSVGYYYFDGSLWVKMITADKDSNLFNSNGLLTGLASSGAVRSLGMNGYSMEFSGSDERTYWSPTGTLSQINNKPYGGLASILLYGGGNSLLSLQQFNGSNSQIYSSNSSTGLMIGTNGNTQSAPISFVTSVGSGASGTEKAVITGEGRMGIGQSFPNATLHVTRLSGDLTPVIIQGCNEYVNNSAAANAGVPIGGVYRTGEVLKIRY